MQHLSQEAGLRRTGSLAIVVLVLIVGSSVGIILFANQGSLLGVLAAALVPGFVVGRVLEPAQATRASEAGEGR